jgi:hypothetical protein
MNRILIAILSLLTGCAAASASAPSTAQTTAPTTAPEQSLLRMSDAVPLSRLRTNDNGTDFASRVKTSGRALLFGQLDTYNDDGDVIATEPVIAYKDAADVTQVLRINDRRLHDAAWQFVATGPKTGEIWGVLDASLEAMQESILLVHSTDDGKTFAVIAIHKPDRRADYDSLSLDKTGRGRLSVFMAGDAKRHLLQGYYNYLTTDGGATWSSPQREPDALKRADDASDDDQDDSAPPTQRA